MQLLVKVNRLILDKSAATAKLNVSSEVGRSPLFATDTLREFKRVRVMVKG
jgi:hypothetical protein